MKEVKGGERKNQRDRAEPRSANSAANSVKIALRESGCGETADSAVSTQPGPECFKVRAHAGSGEGAGHQTGKKSHGTVLSEGPWATKHARSSSHDAC